MATIDRHGGGRVGIELAVLHTDNEKLRAENERLRAALTNLVRRIRQLAEFYVDLDDAPDGAVPAWDLVALTLDAAKAVLGKEEPDVNQQ